MSCSAAEQANLEQAIRLLREIKPLGLSTEKIAREFIALLQEPNQTRLPTPLQNEILRFADEARIIIEIKNTPDKQFSGGTQKRLYKSSIFKCLEDYEKCNSSYSTVLCGSLLVECVAQQLIPFAQS